MSDAWLKSILMIPARVHVAKSALAQRFRHWARRRLERTSTINGGYSPFFCCKACGQEWYEDWEQLKFGGNTRIRKATWGQAVQSTQPK
jgi:hypothetical protein